MQLHVASVEMIYTEQDNNINEKTTQLFSYERKTIFIVMYGNNCLDSRSLSWHNPIQ